LPYMPEKKDNLLLFDVDGVIIDSFDIVYKGVLNFIESRGGKGITQEEFRDFFDGNALAKVLEASGLESPTEISEDELAKMYGNYQKAPIFEGMADTIQQLAKDNTLVIVTSTQIENVSERLEAAGLNHLFAAFLGPRAAVHKDRKIQMALEEFGPDTDDVYFISDTLGDLLEVKDIGGIKRVAATWGYQDRGTLGLATPDFYAEKPEDLLNILTA